MNSQATAIGISTRTGMYRALLILLGLFTVFGISFYILEIRSGASPTSWGMLTTNFLFLMSISHFGVCFVAMMRICNAQWAKPFYRLGELVTLAYAPIAFVLLVSIYVFARQDIFFWITAEDVHNPWLNETWLLYRNILGLAVFYGLAFWYFIVGLLPDLDNDMGERARGWRKGLYGWLLSLKAGKDEASLKERAYKLSPWILVIAVVTNTIIAWDFGMMIYPHYHSTVFPMYYILGNMFAGTATLLLLFVIMSWFVPTDAYFSRAFNLRSMGIILTAFSLLWLYFFWAQFFVTWFGNLPHEYRPLWKQLYGHYSVYFWAQIICVLGIPLGFLVFARVKRTLWPMILLSLTMAVGIWLNRYLTVVPALANEHEPFSVFSEVVLGFGLLAGFLFFLMYLFNVFPMLSMWEIKNIPEDMEHH